VHGLAVPGIRLAMQYISAGWGCHYFYFIAAALRVWQLNAASLQVHRGSVVYILLGLVGLVGFH